MGTLLEQVTEEVGRLLAIGKIDINVELKLKFIGDKRVLADIKLLAESGYGEDNFGNNISIILSGSFLIEKVFNINGMGLLGYESIVERDYPVVLGILVISSVLFMIGNILSDICVAIVDPRVKFE